MQETFFILRLIIKHKKGFIMKKLKLEKLQKEITRELVNDEKFIEAALQAIKDLKIKSYKKYQVSSN